MFGTSNIKEASSIVPSPRVENCEMTKISIGEYDNKKILEFHFKDATGATMIHKEFDPSEKLESDTQERFEQKISWVMSRIKHIMGRFMTEDEATIPDVATWEGFIQQVGSRFNGKYKGVKCALKIIYKNNKFSSFPMFPDFISTETYPKTFRDDPMYDKYEIEGSEGATSTPAASNGAAVSDPFGDDDGEAVNQSSEPNTASVNF